MMRVVAMIAAITTPNRKNSRIRVRSPVVKTCR
jgi:hypothetical protein